MIIRTLASVAVLSLAAGAAPVAMAQASISTSPAATASGFATSDATDPYLWLEEVEGERVMDWVKAHNETSLGVLQGDPR